MSIPLNIQNEAHRSRQSHGYRIRAKLWPMIPTWSCEYSRLFTCSQNLASDVKMRPDEARNVLLPSLSQNLAY